MLWLFWVYVFYAFFLLFAYFDHRNLRDVGVYSEKASFYSNVVLVLLLGPLGILVFLLNRFKSVAKYAAASNGVPASVIKYDGGYIACLSLVPAAFVFLAWATA